MADCVLLIISNNSVLRQAHIPLRDAGYLVVSLNELELAIELLKHMTFDLVVADVITLKASRGETSVNKGLSLLLHYTHNTPVMLGSQGPEGAKDLVDLTNPLLLLERVRETIEVRRSLYPFSDDGDDERDSDATVYGPLLASARRSGPWGLLVQSDK